MRLWITGVGIVSPLATGAHATMSRLCSGDRAFASVRVFDGSPYKVSLVSEVPALAADHREPSAARTEAMAIEAAREALLQARLAPGVDPVDLIFGTTTAMTLEIEERLAALFDQPLAQPLPPELTDTLALSAERVANAVGPFGRVRTISSACSTGAMALVLAASWIRSGHSSCVLAGAADGLCRLTLTGFNALGSLDPHPCRPFDQARGGLSLGEGAAFVVIERDDVALARGATPIAELAGWGAGAEAHHITNPEPSGSTPSRLTRDALRLSGLTTADVDYVNAHGTATALNDPMEIQALRAVFLDDFDRVYVSSSKGQIGHTLGAAGAIEAVVSALAVQQQRIPPTAGLDQPAEDCRANHTIGAAVDVPVRAALSNSFGFGGLDAVLLIARPLIAAPHPSPHRPRIVLIGAATLGPLGLRSASSAHEYLATGPAPGVGPIPFDEASLLDLSRARRLGRAERLLVAAIGRTIQDVGGLDTLGDPNRVGLVASRLSGNPGPTARFLAKARDRGARFAPPADFPNLMLSSIAGHASIYHRLHGPALATTDRGASGAAALLTASELLSSGCADVMFAGSADDWDIGGQAQRTVAIQGISDDVFCTEGASSVLLCRDDHPAVSTASPAVRLQEALCWFDPQHRSSCLDRLGAPSAMALLVVVGGPDEASIPPAWRLVPRAPIEARTGHHDATAGIAIAAGMSAVAARTADLVLVIVQGACSGYAFLMGAL